MIILVPVNYQNPHLISLDAAPSTPPALLLNPAKVCKRCSKTRNICPAVNFSCVFCDPERVSSELVFKFFSSKRNCHFFYFTRHSCAGMLKEGAGCSGSRFDHPGDDKGSMIGVLRKVPPWS